MEEHFVDDPLATPEEVRQAELLLNNTARSISKIINIGRGTTKAQDAPTPSSPTMPPSPHCKGSGRTTRTTLGVTAPRGPNSDP